MWMMLGNMGTVEEIRKVMQDFLAPELRALTAKLDAMDEKINLRFDAAEVKMQALRGEIAQVRELLDLDRRLARLEAK
jgi:hypothetical protein